MESDRVFLPHLERYAHSARKPAASRDDFGDRLSVVDFQTLPPRDLQLARIQPHLAQDGRVDVRDVMPALNSVKAKFVRAAMGHAALDSPARHPNTEPKNMMIAPIGALGSRGAAKLGRKNDQRFLKQPTPLQVRQQCADRLIYLH